MRRIGLIIIIMVLMFSIVSAKNDPLYVNNKKLFNIFDGQSPINYANRFNEHTIIPTHDDGVVVFGSNHVGELGLGIAQKFTFITKSNLLTEIVQNNGGADNIYFMKVDGFHGIIIFKNGRVYVWGRNMFGQLGLGDTSDRILPIENTLLEQIIQNNGGVNNIYRIYIGDDSNLLIFKNGNVYVWGDNSYRTFPGISDTMVIEPTLCSNLTNIIQNNGGVQNIYVFNYKDSTQPNGMIIFNNGKVYIWGSNYYYELGSDNATILPLMENIELEDIIQQNGGVNNIYKLYSFKHAKMLIFKNGKVYVWGENYDGKLGKGNFYTESIKENTILENVIQNNGGIDNIYKFCVKNEDEFYGYSVLIFRNGKVYVWGDNLYGQLGLGDTTNKNTPTENPNLENIIQQNGGMDNIYDIHCEQYKIITIFKNGKIYYSGENWYRVPYLPKNDEITVPTEINVLETLVTQNGGIDNLYYLGNVHEIIHMIFKNSKTYGETYKRIIDELNVYLDDAPNITEISSITSIIESKGGTDAIKKLITFGSGYIMIFNDSEVYVGGSSKNKVNSLVLDPEYIGSPSFNQKIKELIQQNGGHDNVFKFVYGENSNILIFRNGKVYVWGGDPYFYWNKTVDVINITEFKELEKIIYDNGGVDNIYMFNIDTHRRILIFKNNRVYLWGTFTEDEQIMGYPTENSTIEKLIVENGGVDNIFSFNIGSDFNIIIFKNGKVYVWGRNDYGQLGLGDRTYRDTPTENTNLENIIQQNGGVDNIYGFYTGYMHSILIFKNGKVYAWGQNFYGELGVKNSTHMDTPSEIANIENIIQQNGGVDNIYRLYVDYQHNLIIFKNGKIYAWGTDSMIIGNPYNFYIPSNNIPTNAIISRTSIPTYVVAPGSGPIYTLSQNPIVELTDLENKVQENGGIDNIYKVIIGRGYSAIIFKNLNVFVWGMNDFNQLGIIKDKFVGIMSIPTEQITAEQILQSHGLFLGIRVSSDIIKVV